MTKHRHQLEAYSTPWRKLTPEDLQALTHEVLDNQESYVFTLNFSKEVAAAASEHDDPAAYMSARFRRSLRKIGAADLPYSFRFEVSPDGRLHIHGFFVRGSHDLEAIRLAFKAAGSRSPQKRQFHQEETNAASRWEAYSRKDHRRTTEYFGSPHRHSFVSRSLNKLTKEHHEKQHIYWTDPDRKRTPLPQRLRESVRAAVIKYTQRQPKRTAPLSESYRAPQDAPPAQPTSRPEPLYDDQQPLTVRLLNLALAGGADRSHTPPATDHRKHHATKTDPPRRLSA